MSDRWLYGWALSSIALGGASLVVPLYLVDLGGGPFVLGLLAAVAALVGVPGALGAGRITDRTGKRRELVLAALALIAVSIAAVPLFDRPLPVIVANGVLWFAFAAATPVLTLVAVADVEEAAWSERIAILNKYQGIGWAVGLLVGTLWTALGTRVLPAEVVLPSLFVPLAACAALGLLDGLRALPANPDSPTAEPISHDRLRRALRRTNRFSVRTATFPFTVGRADFADLHPRRFVDRFTPTLAVYFLAVCCCFAGFSVFFAPLPVFLAEEGFGSGEIFGLYLISSLAAAAFFGATGRLTTKRDVELVQIAGLSIRGLAFPAVAVVGVALGSTTLGFGLAAVVFAVIGLTWAVIAVTAGTLVTRFAPASIRGEALGMYAALGALAGGVGSVLGGWLAAESYLLAFGAAGGLVLSGAVIVLLGRQRATAARKAVQTPS